jgi:hypothetical protein
MVIERGAVESLEVDHLVVSVGVEEPDLDPIDGAESASYRAVPLPLILHAPMVMEWPCRRTCGGRPHRDRHVTPAVQPVGSPWWAGSGWCGPGQQEAPA